MATLWDSQTFTSVDPVTDRVASSSSFSNSNDKNSVEVTVVYETFSPENDTTVTNYRLQAIVEREIATNVWIPMVGSFKRIGGLSDPLKHVIVVTPQFNPDPGS